MSEFNNYPSYLQAGDLASETTTIDATETYYNLNLGVANSLTSKGTGIKYKSGLSGSINLNMKGIYVFQFMFSFTGGTNKVYQFILNSSARGYIEHTRRQFSTKGSDMWEVQFMFLINNDFKPLPSGAGNMQGATTCNEIYSPLIQNKSNADNITIANGNILIYKIN